MYKGRILLNITSPSLYSILLFYYRCRFICHAGLQLGRQVGRAQFSNALSDQLRGVHGAAPVHCHARAAVTVVVDHLGGKHKEEISYLGIQVSEGLQSGKH